MQVLSSLPPQDDPRILVGSSTFDDAGVLALDEHVALVQTTDFFPPVVDDPWWYGRIAAANALSDVYAMGGRPLCVLNIVAFNTKALPLTVLATILQGAADAVREAGAVTLGGHSVEDEGVKFGLAVTGTVRPGAQVTNAGARPGDVLYLTKALGTGSITTAGRKEQVAEDVLASAQRQMGALNAGAAEAMVAIGVNAATDVTGYGLAGHAHEVAAASGVDLVFSAAALPLLPGALELAGRGCLSGGKARTQAYLGSKLVVGEGVDPLLVDIACDAETSGGLLIAVSASRSAALRDELGRRSVLVSVVGRVEAATGVPRVRIEP